MAMCNVILFMVEKNSASSGVQSVDPKSLVQQVRSSSLLSSFFPSETIPKIIAKFHRID